MKQSMNKKTIVSSPKSMKNSKNYKSLCICIRNLFSIFLDSTKLKIVWKKIIKFFKRRVSIIL